MSGVESGLLLRRDQPEAWVAAYASLKNPEQHEAWATVGRPYVEANFTLPVQIEALERMMGL